jgi:hypothetical protein
VKPTVDIFDNFLQSLTWTFDVKKSTISGNENTIKLCGSLWWIRPMSEVFLDGVPFIVVSVKPEDNSFTVSSNVDLQVKEVKLKIPFYFHGTPLATSNELNMIDWTAKYPLIYLMEVIQDDIQEDESVNSRISTLRLFFLDQSNFNDWLTDDHYLDAINPMANLAEYVVSEMKKSSMIGLIGKYKLTYHANFNPIFTFKGHEKQLFNDHLSGVELRIDVPFRREQCEC